MPGLFRGASCLLALSCCSVAALPLSVSAQTPATAPSADAKDPNDLSQFKTADELWTHISQLPKKMGGDKDKLIAAGKAALDDLIKRFPASDKVWNARILKVQIMGIKEISSKEAAAKYEEIANEKDAPPKAQEEARFRALGSLLSAAGEAKDPALLEGFEAKLEAFEKTKPAPAVIARLRKGQLDALTDLDPAKAKVLAKKLSESSDESLKALGNKYIAQSELKTKPVELKFTAVDGKEVDLEKLRGKVVLIDFWATWCGPCVAEVPNVVASYNKLKDKGFEIVGISLDKKKDTMLEFIKANNMPWPQFCDEKGWSNEISTRFGISSIPAMWLIDKKGMLVSTNARANLEAAVEKLLAE